MASNSTTTSQGTTTTTPGVVEEEFKFGQVRSVVNVDELNEIFETEYERDHLVLMDCHRKWCGPCTVLVPTYRNLVLDVENANEKKISLVSVCFEDLSKWYDESKESDKKGKQPTSSNGFDGEHGKRDKKFFRGMDNVLGKGEQEKMLEIFDTLSHTCKPSTILFKVKKGSETPLVIINVIYGADAPAVTHAFSNAIAQCAF